MRPCKPVQNADARISSLFGERTLNGEQQFHRGIDIVSNAPAVPVYTTREGTVVAAGFSDTFGLRVWVDTHDGWYSVYAHLHDIAQTVVVGERINADVYIGMMGDTGRSFGRHLHYEERTAPDTSGESRDPSDVVRLYLPHYLSCAEIDANPLAANIAKDALIKQGYREVRND